jgi:hypothetical protein
MALRRFFKGELSAEEFLIQPKDGRGRRKTRVRAPAIQLPMLKTIERE